MRGTDAGRFGIGMHAWAIERRPDLLDAALEAHPFLHSLSFGSPAPYVERVHGHGILVATQVNSHVEALEEAHAGVALIVVQGQEAGGHVTGQVSTLPLLQVVLEAVQVPVFVAALAAGAEGVWVGTCLLASPKCENTEQARSRLVQAQETDTVLTRVFDIARELVWPPKYPGRALRNCFMEQWHAHSEARQELVKAVADKNYELAYIYQAKPWGW